MTERDGGKAKGAERKVDGLDPIGAALRATYDAENHDSLGGDLTGLMLALARVDDRVPGPAPLAAPAPATAPVARRSWRLRLFGQ